MPAITYEQLDNLTHEVADLISNTTGIDPAEINLFRLNDTLTSYLQDFHGVEYEDEDDPERSTDGN